ncbi:MAG: phosphoserine aminotransferase [Phycisphaerae bacterium]|nr:Phosphoserine aminotransferase [Phycisphaerales bacterium]MCK6478112.1 3-phosphoserine/phosphohydroxythreonine transaminase [Phycisphaerales bacterium]
MTTATPTTPTAASAAGIKSAVVKTATGRTFNFSAGPGCLPEEVLKQVQQDVYDIAGTGIGILEHSHRGKTYDRVLHEAFEDFRKISNLPANYHLLFLTGGASTQNFMVPANLKPQDQAADYITTGYWAEKSLEHAKVYGLLHEAATSKDKNHSYIPSDAQIKYSASPAYVHFCSNNTIFGTEWHETDAGGNNTWRQRTPAVPAGVPLVCDMSSDIYSRPVDFTKYGLVYAGAQKNLGAAGTTVVVIRDDLATKKVRELPWLLRYETFAKDESRPNTPPVFAIYVCGLVFKWILAQGQGGRHCLDVIHERNIRKAGHVYAAIDGSGGFYKGHAEKNSRSLMNLTFKCATPELDDKFCKEAAAVGLDGLKGHRSTGGMRASTYNAMPEEGAKVLADFMREFARRNG